MFATEPVETEGLYVLSEGDERAAKHHLISEPSEGFIKCGFVVGGELGDGFVHECSGGDGHAGYAGGGFGDGVAVGSAAFDVEGDAFAD